jgi:hypothetical protein
MDFRSNKVPSMSLKVAVQMARIQRIWDKIEAMRKAR